MNYRKLLVILLIFIPLLIKSDAKKGLKKTSKSPPNKDPKKHRIKIKDAKNSKKQCTCGRTEYDDSDYVIGGYKADEKRYPWMVYIKVNKNGVLFYCGGTLISARHILTAAHCTLNMTTIWATK